MKYMGSKRWMLENGLGELLDSAAPRATRFVDLFSGSAAVGSFVATKHNVEVISADLQSYSRILSAAIVGRTTTISASVTWPSWKRKAKAAMKKVRSVPQTSKITREIVREARDWCGRRKKWNVTRAYGGHYFSPTQALWIDAFRSTLPNSEPHRTVALASLIEAAAYCAAAPGHTAQPFQPTRTAKKFLKEAWDRSLPSRVEAIFGSLCKQHARVKGNAVVADAVDFAKTLRTGDLAFVDPPYSAVHYSRFYHVLETVATGRNEEVTGVGRYQRGEFRPKSDFSFLSKSKSALDALLKQIAKRGANAIVTFPDHKCSNGLSGELVTETAAKYFTVHKKVVSSKFSTLGGTSGASATGSERAARQSAKELILHLKSNRRKMRRAMRDQVR